MDKEFYIYLSSRDSKQTFPTNSAGDFSVLLPERLQFNPLDSWSCGLVELSIPDELTDSVFLCSNFSKNSIVGEQRLPVLRRIVGGYSDPSHVTYVPIRSTELSIVHLYLTRYDGVKVSLSSGETYCTLHFIQNHQS